jgi:hypothetical protein
MPQTASTHPAITLPASAITVNCCPAWFTGLNTAHCTTCHAAFTTVSGFDKHRTGSHENDTRRCLDPATMKFPKSTKRAGQMVFEDAGRAYPCWRTSAEEGKGWTGPDGE